MTDPNPNEEADLQEKLGSERLISWLDSTVVDADDIKSLVECSFHAISFNVTLKWDQKFYPNELGAARFSLKNGVTDKFHRLIDPGKIPVGSRMLADSHQHSHRLPVDDLASECSKFNNFRSPLNSPRYYDQILNDLLEFLRPGAAEINGYKNYFVFVKATSSGDQIMQVLGSLKFLAEKSDNPHFKILLSEKRIFVMSVTTLAENILLITEKGFQPQKLLTACEDISLAFSPHLNCEFHNEKESDYCALAVATRVWYCISQPIMKPLGLEPILGSHIPRPAQPIISSKLQAESNSLAHDIFERSSNVSFRSSSSHLPGPIRASKHYQSHYSSYTRSTPTMSAAPMSISSAGTERSQTSRPPEWSNPFDESSRLVQRGPSSHLPNPNAGQGRGRGRRLP